MATLRARVLPRWPVLVQGEGGVTVDLENGSATIGFDYADSELGTELEQAVEAAEDAAQEAQELLEEVTDEVSGLQAQIEAIAAGVALPVLRYALYATMVADVSQETDTLALVYGEATDGDGGNGIYQWDGGTWIFVADAPFQQLDARLAVVEAGTADLISVQQFGTMPIKSASDTSSFDFVSKADLVQPSIAEQSLTSAGSRQIAVGSSLATTWTVTTGGDDLILTLATNPAGSVVVALTGDMVVPGAAYLYRFKPGTLGVVPGMVLAFSDVAPVLGGAATTLPANAVTLVWRMDIGIVVVQDETGVVDSTDLTISNVTGFLSATAVADDECTWSITFGPDGTTANCILTVNGVSLYTFTASGFTPNWFVSPGFRASAVADTGRLHPYDVLAPGLDNSLEVFVDPAASSGNTGKTADSPFNLADLANFIAADTGRRSVTFTLAQGEPEDYQGLTFAFDASTRRDVTIRSVNRRRAVLTGSVKIESGTAAWTQPDAGGNPLVWMTPAVGASASIIQVGRPQTCGQNDLTTLDNALYASANYTDEFGAFQQASRATMNLAGNAGFVANQLTGADAGNMLIHTLDGDDPNDYDWWAQDASYVISASLSDSTSPVRMRLFVDNITMRFCFFGMTSSVPTYMNNVDVEYVTPGAGFFFTQGSGILNNCSGLGILADCFSGNPPTFTITGTITNGSPIITAVSVDANGFDVGSPLSSIHTEFPAFTTIVSIDSATQITVSANATTSTTAVFFVSAVIGTNDAPMIFNNCKAIGSPTISPTVPANFGGDGWSNHKYSSIWHLNNCYAKSQHGRGGAFGKNTWLNNFVVEDSFGFVGCFIVDSQDTSIRILGGWANGCLNGIEVSYLPSTAPTSPGTVTSAFLHAVGVAFKDTGTLVNMSTHATPSGIDFLTAELHNCVYNNGGTTSIGDDCVLTATSYTAFTYP